MGTVYTREELESLRAACDKLGLYLMMDGARLGAALESGVDYTLNDIANGVMSSILEELKMVP